MHLAEGPKRCTKCDYEHQIDEPIYVGARLICPRCTNVDVVTRSGMREATGFELYADTTLRHAIRLRQQQIRERTPN